MEKVGVAQVDHQVGFRLFEDSGIRAHLHAHDAVGWMREAVLAHGKDALSAPPRVHAALGEGAGGLVFTAGRFAGKSYGFRAYSTLELPVDEQVVVAFDDHTGRVCAIAVGSELGVRRTSALGGVAHDALAPKGSVRVAVIGSGVQAQGQLWALQAVRSITEVKLFSKTPDRKVRVAEALDQQYDFPVVSAESVEEAVAAADVVILATNSESPVLRTQWLRPDAYVATLGPKQVGRAEFAADLLAAASVITTDSVAQLNAYDPPAVAAEAGVAVAPLSQYVLAPPPAEGIRLYLSVGLAGTEPYLLQRLAQQVAAQA
ncbi:hypothetical protein NQ015_10540 [Corynebacterium sp. 153RC1]|uniref:hypothetical protein n=1 Tax=unclassified Corynebacterium TaxID=2624378 RepID=UPI00211BE811|nr:hypothetical protein [Corynebacterium sp. 209RC1]MCQ9355668.1 hypothetical protein [Corynebacterium sp. 1222RC1]MCQ9357861.1 hypothetical protein [Corynebacterium sp. 122RC1]MCQ9360045.1 hypothetical protein [Corynebacterium sp. 142RC1]MCQ9362189.1 hypothetical protein [Corynebacterium sp. 153RC1]MCQ9364329.1 hypothetical protein [Corynebacterium sp. 732RC1]MCQ9366490.1 hypothetical protein [Corynebacterium sp. 70RC1]